MGRIHRGGEEPVPQVTEIIIGSPNTPAGGRITGEYLLSKMGVNPATERGFDVDAQTNAEILRSIFAQDPHSLSNSRVIVHSVSMGAFPSERTAQRLVREFPQLQGHIQVLRDNPVLNKISPSELQNWFQRIQIGVGYIGQGIGELKTNERFRSVIEMEKVFMPEIKKYLKQGRYDENNPQTQIILQYMSALIDVFNLMSGSEEQEKAKRIPFENTSLIAVTETQEERVNREAQWAYRVYNRVGLKDPTTFSLRSVARYTRTSLMHGKHKSKIIAWDDTNGLSFAMYSAHIPHYYRVKEWDRIINDFCRWNEVY